MLAALLMWLRERGYGAETMTWSKPITTGAVPSQRAGHTYVVVVVIDVVMVPMSAAVGLTARRARRCSCVGTKLFVFGGGDGGLYLNDLYVLDTGTLLLPRCKSRSR